MSHVAQVSDVAHGPLVYDNVSALKISKLKSKPFSFFHYMRFFRLDPNVHPISIFGQSFPRCQQPVLSFIVLNLKVIDPSLPLLVFTDLCNY